ncbi:hypothetical protein AVEN_84385-1 [Araneus ventricosus]|uniref:Secreted protein n=1 Tax=Araneus ventricosus TaxID=182803 RepID=A0A4Y2X6V6_ARAVE|nr:hypothetical protein AVEN_84385-1 [Araneus ventricosus]
MLLLYILFLNNLSSVNICPTNWIKVNVIFYSGHGPFPAYHKSPHLSDRDYCSCGANGTKLHNSTWCVLKMSWHKPDSMHVCSRFDFDLMLPCHSKFDASDLKRTCGKFAVATIATLACKTRLPQVRRDK